MRTVFGVLLLSAMPSLAADSDFNGRWDLTTLTQPRPRAWWVELTGVGSLKPAGKFVSAYGGDMNTVDTVAVENGELRFTIANPGRNAKGPAPVYRARLVNGKLEGTLETPGSAAPPLKWTGPRSPVCSFPAVKPTLPPPTRVIATLPSDRGVTDNVHLPPSSTKNAVTEPSAPVKSDVSGHGGRPALRASPEEQMSPPTTQMPWRMASATERPTSGAPTAGAATSNSAAMRATAAMYSSVA